MCTKHINPTVQAHTVRPHQNCWHVKFLFCSLLFCFDFLCISASSLPPVISSLFLTELPTQFSAKSPAATLVAPEYVITIAVGSPPQKLTVLLDTGSSDLVLLTQPDDATTTASWARDLPLYKPQVSSTAVQTNPGPIPIGYGAGNSTVSLYNDTMAFVLPNGSYVPTHQTVTVYSISAAASKAGYAGIRSALSQGSVRAVGIMGIDRRAGDFCGAYAAQGHDICKDNGTPMSILLPLMPKPVVGTLFEPTAIASPGISFGLSAQDMGWEEPLSAVTLPLQDGKKDIASPVPSMATFYSFKLDDVLINGTSTGVCSAGNNCFALADAGGGSIEVPQALIPSQYLGTLESSLGFPCNQSPQEVTFTLVLGGRKFTVSTAEMIAQSVSDPNVCQQQFSVGNPFSPNKDVYYLYLGNIFMRKFAISWWPGVADGQVRWAYRRNDPNCHRTLNGCPSSSPASRPTTIVLTDQDTSYDDNAVIALGVCLTVTATALMVMTYMWWARGRTLSQSNTLAMANR